MFSKMRILSPKATSSERGHGTYSVRYSHPLTEVAAEQAWRTWHYQFGWGALEDSAESRVEVLRWVKPRYVG